MWIGVTNIFLDKNKRLTEANLIVLRFFFNWDSLHARLKQPLRGMELQEKEAQKD